MRTIAELAALLRMDEGTIRRAIKRGDIEVVRVEGLRGVRIAEETVQRLTTPVRLGTATNGGTQ